MKTYESLLAQGISELEAAEVAEPDINAWYLLAWTIAVGRENERAAGTLLSGDKGVEKPAQGYASDVPDDVADLLRLAAGMPARAWFILHGSDEADEFASRIFTKLTGYRAMGCPLEYITHYTEFMGLPFYVDPAVLIPRQDTECLVEEAVKLSEGKDVLDLCTGSGCIAVSISALGKPASVTATDKSREALKVACINAALNKAGIRFLYGDLFDAVGAPETEDGCFDMITCNPPYIRRDVIPDLMREVRDFEPVMALDGGEDGLDFYRKLAKEAGAFLRKDGIILMRSDTIRRMMLRIFL